MNSFRPIQGSFCKLIFPAALSLNINKKREIKINKFTTLYITPLENNNIPIIELFLLILYKGIQIEERTCIYGIPCRYDDFDLYNYYATYELYYNEKPVYVLVNGVLTDLDQLFKFNKEDIIEFYGNCGEFYAELNNIV